MAKFVAAFACVLISISMFIGKGSRATETQEIFSALQDGMTVDGGDPDGGDPDPSCSLQDLDAGIETFLIEGAAEPDCVADVGDCCSATVPNCNLAYRQVSCPGTGDCSTRSIGPIYAHRACARWQRPTVCGSRGTPTAVHCRRTSDPIPHDCVVDITTCRDATPRACTLPAPTTRDCPYQIGDPTNYCEDRIRYSDERCVPVDIDYCYATQAGVVDSITCRNR